ncbi:MAG: hypothetical protein IJA62_00090 [Ruminococcus sp.]|nr:hypothetical protein [Ruminococcus sp.]
MITDKLTIFGDREDVTNICDLLSKCGCHLESEAKDTVLYVSEVPDNTAYPESVCVVLPHELRERVSGGRITTYSEKDSNADVTLLNLQKRETAFCFEVLCGASMSRVFVPYGKGYTCLQVLAGISVLCAWGVSALDAVSKINSILK